MPSQATFFRAGLAAVLLSLGANPTSGATINYSSAEYPDSDPAGAQQWLDFQQTLVSDPRIKISNVTETSSGTPALNPDVPLLYPLVPTATSSTSGMSVTFKPTSYAQVDTTSPSADPFDIKSKRSELNMMFSAQKNTNSADSGIAGYAINRIDFQMTGDLSLAAPFYNKGSAAYAEIRTILSLTLQQVDYKPVDTPITAFYELPLYVTNQDLNNVSQVTSKFFDSAFATSSGADSRSYTWDTRAVSMDLRKMFNMTNSPGAITDVSLSLISEVRAAGYYGLGSSNVSKVIVGSGIEAIAAQPVPEPPTIILAGLGAVAVVANGYRRKKQRRDAEAEMPLDDMEETGAIALTA